MKTRSYNLTALAALLGALMAPVLAANAQTAAAPAPTNAIEIVVLEGSALVLPADQSNWQPAHLHQALQPHDHLRVAENSRVAVRWSDDSVITFKASSEAEILPPENAESENGFQLLRGIISFFHRDKPGRIPIITRSSRAGVIGTEFVMAVDDNDRTTLAVLDGRVKIGNDHATLELTNSEEASVDLGQAPKRTAGFIANNLLQWCFYYPAVIDPDEVPLTTDEANTLSASLAAYRAGDLPGALAKFPTNAPASDAVNVYHASVLLAVGEVAEAEKLLGSLGHQNERIDRLAGALRQLIAAVKRQPAEVASAPQLASEFLARSYYQQSLAVRETSLENALASAKQAVKSDKFGFAWERVAELEFSFGRLDKALAALDRSLALSPSNAQALALKGFILTAQSRPRQARDWFDRAIAADSALGNAWLGRGLARIELGDAKGGKGDLLVAAALEPQRSELRSYLGKAYIAAGDQARAQKELALAAKLDPNDPTPSLYSALLKQRGNQINGAIEDLETSQSLNNNRCVYRSQLLLDQDSAIRSANLANIYQDAGMFDTAVNEAGRAVSDDYANYSAHLFLAGSYDQLRSPDWSNTRYDAPAEDEFWIANLLAPASAGWLSTTIAEQPYARLFDKDHVGAVSDTTYLSRGAISENADGFYTSDRFDVDFETAQITDPGQRPNEAFQEHEYDVNLKGQLTPRDTIFGSLQWLRIGEGDVNEYYNQSSASPGAHYTDTQEPNLFLGLHHEWSPGVETLFFASRRSSNKPETDPNSGQLAADIGASGFDAVRDFGVSDYSSVHPVDNSLQLQQIWETDAHTTIVGASYDWGSVAYQNFEATNAFSGLLPHALFADQDPLVAQKFKLYFHHFSVYGYHTWHVADPLAITVGLSYDWLHEPNGSGSMPFVQTNGLGANYPLAQADGAVNSPETSKSQISPKAGLVWTPTADTTVRGSYTRSQADFIWAQTDQLEPTEVAGFNQAFGSLIPESIVADSSGSRFDAFNISFEQKFPTRTYLILSASDLYSEFSDLQSAFVELQNSPQFYSAYPLGLLQSFYYRERTVSARVDQLVADQWVFGAKYSLSQANLDSSYPDFLAAAPAGGYYDKAFVQHESLESVLQTVALNVNWNHRTGLFAIGQAEWFHQSNTGFSPAEPGQGFWQLNAYAGYRCWRRKLEFSVGVLNITDQNYSLEPLNLYNEMPRSRTFLARLLVSF